MSKASQILEIIFQERRQNPKMGEFVRSYPGPTSTLLLDLAGQDSQGSLFFEMGQESIRGAIPLGIRMLALALVPFFPQFSMNLLIKAWLGRCLFETEGGSSRVDLSVSQSQAVLDIQFAPQEEMSSQCQFRRGFFQTLPHYLGFGETSSLEKTCFHGGSEICHYSIRAEGRGKKSFHWPLLMIGLHLICLSLYPFSQSFSPLHLGAILIFFSAITQGLAQRRKGLRDYLAENRTQLSLYRSQMRSREKSLLIDLINKTESLLCSKKWDSNLEHLARSLAEGLCFQTVRYLQLKKGQLKCLSYWSSLGLKEEGQDQFKQWAQGAIESQKIQIENRVCGPLSGQALMAVPVAREGKVLGVFILQAPLPGRPCTPSDRRFLEAFSFHLAKVITFFEQAKALRQESLKTQNQWQVTQKQFRALRKYSAVELIEKNDNQNLRKVDLAVVACGDPICASLGPTSDAQRWQQVAQTIHREAQKNSGHSVHFFAGIFWIFFISDQAKRHRENSLLFASGPISQIKGISLGLAAGEGMWGPIPMGPKWDILLHGPALQWAMECQQWGRKRGEVVVMTETLSQVAQSLQLAHYQTGEMRSDQGAHKLYHLVAQDLSLAPSA